MSCSSEKPWVQDIRVAIHDIPDQGLKLQENLDPTSLELNTEDLTYKGPVHVHLTMQKTESVVWAEMDVSGEQEAICGRCLEPYSQTYHQIFNVEYEPDLVHLDVTDDIRQELILNYPIQFVCREDCSGLCSQCGKDLNSAACQCAE